jgi:hypothetical protein
MNDQQLEEMRKELWEWLETRGRDVQVLDPTAHARSYDRALALEQIVALHQTNKRLDRIIDLLQAKFGYPPVDS